MNYLKRAIIINKIKKNPVSYRYLKNDKDKEYQSDLTIIKHVLKKRKFFEMNVFVETIANNFNRFNSEEKEFIFSHIFDIYILFPDLAKKIVSNLDEEFLINNYICGIEELYSDIVLVELYSTNTQEKIKLELFKRIENSDYLLKIVLGKILYNADKIIEIYCHFCGNSKKEKIINEFLLDKINQNKIDNETIISLISINPFLYERINNQEVLNWLVNQLITNHLNSLVNKSNKNQEVLDEIIEKSNNNLNFLIKEISKLDISSIENIVNNLNYNSLKKLVTINPIFFQYIATKPNFSLRKFCENLQNIEELEILLKYYPFFTIKGYQSTRSSTGIRGETIYENLPPIGEINCEFLLKNCELLNNMDYNLITYFINIGNNSEVKIELFFNILKKLYDKDTFNNILPSINVIFKNFNRLYFESETLKNFRIGEEYKFCFKLLFNKEILLSNNHELVNSFIHDFCNNKESATDKFYQIIGNTYGQKAVAILKSRPGLNILTISSLEVFRPEILNNFKEGFIHDLLSYDVLGFNAFLSIIKNEEDLELYKVYYELMSKVHGENVVTMQKTFSNYFYVKDLIKDAIGRDLTDIQQLQLLTVLCGEFNICNIKNVNQLDEYDILLNKNLQYTINSIDNIEQLKQILFKNLFSLNLADYIYYKALPSYNINSELYTGVNENEILVMKTLNFIKECKNIDELKNFAFEILKESNVRTPISAINLLSKIKKNEIYLINKNQNYLTPTKINELIQSGSLELRKIEDVEILVYKELDSLNIGYICHSRGITIDEFLTLEGSRTCSTISTWAREHNGFSLSRLNSHSFFTHVPDDTEVVAYFDGDAGVAGESKKVYSTNTHPKEYNPMCFMYGELAFYRRHRDHKNISNKNYGGRIIPNLLFQLNSENIEFAKKHGAIIMCSEEQFDEYIKLNNSILSEGGKTR